MRLSSSRYNKSFSERLALPMKHFAPLRIQCAPSLRAVVAMAAERRADRDVVRERAVERFSDGVDRRRLEHEMLQAGEAPPAEFTRPEVAKILIDAMKA